MYDKTIGEIILFAGDFIPKNFMECNGDFLEIKDHQALYSILQTTYGGDGKDEFALPILSPPLGGGKYMICVEGIYPSRS